MRHWATRGLLSATLWVLLAGPTEATELTIGLIPEQNVFNQVKRYQLISEYVAKKTGLRMNLTILSRYGNILDRFSEQHMDGAFFGSFTGALAIERLGLDTIARPVNLDGTSTYRGYIFVRKDSGIRTVGDMKRKRLAFVERATTAGYVFPIAYFREQGIADVGRHFSETFFAGSHDAVIRAVLNGQADVGCAKHSMFDRLGRKDPRVAKELTILVTSPDVPSNGLAVRGDLDPAVKRQLREVLLAMDSDPEGITTLERFEALRFVPLARDDYAPVYAIAARAGIDIRKYDYRNQ